MYSDVIFFLYLFSLLLRNICLYLFIDSFIYFYFYFYLIRFILFILFFESNICFHLLFICGIKFTNQSSNHSNHNILFSVLQCKHKLVGVVTMPLQHAILIMFQLIINKQQINYKLKGHKINKVKLKLFCNIKELHIQT